MADEILLRCRTRQTIRVGSRLRFSLGWIFARRRDLILTTDALGFGDLHLPYEEIEDAVIVSVACASWVSRTLFIWRDGSTYGFQLPTVSSWSTRPHPDWDGPLPFPVRYERRKVEARTIWVTCLSAMAIIGFCRLFK